MKDGYLIVIDNETDNETIVEAIPDNTGYLNMEIDDLRFSISGTAIEVTGPIARVKSIVAQAVGGPTERTMAKEAIETTNGKKCINCKGKRYCAKNGCMKTPCGWLCGWDWD